MHNFTENLKFFGQFLRAPRMIGSVIPTSPRVIDHLLSRVDWSATRVFVEYGPGMGTFTRPILQRLRPDGQLVAIDTCGAFIDHLKRAVDDARFLPVQGSAADVEAILDRHAGASGADYVLSGLPFSTLPEGVGDAIVRATHRVLNPGGSFLVYQYSSFVIPMLRPHFPSVTRGRIWRNIPPCVVSAARK